MSSSVGLVLSGGGARGIAHIGVFEVLERERIPIDLLAGTSMGGVIAAGIAAGMNAKDLKELVLSITHNHGMLRLADPGLPNGGIIRGQRILELFKKEFGEITFSDLSKPLSLVAVDLNTHQEIVFRDGSLADALRATISIPGVFTPYQLGKWKLVDGGVLNNLPVDVAAEMGSEITIAVDISLSSGAKFSDWMSSKRWAPKGLMNTVETLEESLYTLRVIEQEKRISQFPPAVLINPELPPNVNSLIGYERVEELISAGEKAAENHLEELINIMQEM